MILNENFLQIKGDIEKMIMNMMSTGGIQ